MQQYEQKRSQGRKVVCGHDRKQYYARGLCRECYEKLRRGQQQDSDSDEENSQGSQSSEKQPKQNETQKKNEPEASSWHSDEQLSQEIGKNQDYKPEINAKKQMWESLKVENQNIVSKERGKKRGRPRIYPIDRQKERRKLSNKQIKSQKSKDLIEIVDKFDDQYPFELNCINEQAPIDNTLLNKAQTENQKSVFNCKPLWDKYQTLNQNSNLNKDEMEKRQCELDRPLIADINIKKEQITTQKQKPQEATTDIRKEVLKKEQILDKEHETRKDTQRSESLIEKIIKKSGQTLINNYQKGKIQQTFTSSKRPKSFEEQDVFEEEENDKTEHRKDSLIKLKDQKCLHKTIEDHQPLKLNQLRQIYHNHYNQRSDQNFTNNKQTLVKSKHKGDRVQWNSESFSPSDDRDASWGDQFDKNGKKQQLYDSRQMIRECKDSSFGQEGGGQQNDFDDNDQPMLSAKDFDSNDFLPESPLVYKIAQSQGQKQPEHMPNMHALSLDSRSKTDPIPMVLLPTILPDPRTLRPSNPSLPLQCGHHIKKNYIVQVCKGCLQRIFVRSQNPQLATRPIFKRPRVVRDLMCGHNEEHYARGLCRNCYKSVFWKNFLLKTRDQYGWDQDRRKEAWKLKEKMLYRSGKSIVKGGQQAEELLQDDSLRKGPQNQPQNKNQNEQPLQKQGEDAQPLPTKRPRICGRKSRTNICGHPQLKHCSLGQCIRCYQKSFAEKKNRFKKTKRKQDGKKKRKKILKRKNKQKKSKVDYPN